jgi:hypothetical protein
MSKTDIMVCAALNYVQNEQMSLKITSVLSYFKKSWPAYTSCGLCAAPEVLEDI